MDMLTICRDPGALPVTEAKQADVGNTSLKTCSFHVTEPCYMVPYPAQERQTMLCTRPNPEKGWVGEMSRRF